MSVLNASIVCMFCVADVPCTVLLPMVVLFTGARMRVCCVHPTARADEALVEPNRTCINICVVSSHAEGILRPKIQPQSPPHPTVGSPEHADAVLEKVRVLVRREVAALGAVVKRG